MKSACETIGWNSLKKWSCIFCLCTNIYIKSLCHMFLCLFLGPLAWIDPSTYEVKLIGITSWGSGTWGCFFSDKSHFALVPAVVNWINQNTRGCNQITCSQNQCMTLKKLKDQARVVMMSQIWSGNQTRIYKLPTTEIIVKNLRTSNYVKKCLNLLFLYGMP